jgi:hypothetical protein
VRRDERTERRAVAADGEPNEQFVAARSAHACSRASLLMN